MTSKVSNLVWRSGLVAVLLLAGAPLLAQDNATTSTPPPAPAGDIGPRELSNFSITGTVTRPTQQEPAAEPQATASSQPAAREATPGTTVAERAATSRLIATGRPAVPSQQAAIDPIAKRPTLRSPGTEAIAPPTPTQSRPVVPLPAAAPSGFSPLPWIAALLLIGAGAVIYFGLQRKRQRYAAPGVSEFVPETPAPAPVRTPPAGRTAAAPVPKAGTSPPPAVSPRPDPIPTPRGTVTSSLRSPAPPTGLVSAGLRPWIELELEPSQALLTDEHAAIAFDVTLYNSGSAPARDVAVEACLINAGQQQDVQLNQFYSTPGAVRDKIPAVAPLARVTLKSAVRLPRSAVQEYEVEGRKLFMPMVAVNSRYRWSSGEGQSAASFMVGRAADDRAKLGPLRVDQGARGWKGLAARRYEKGIRV